MYKSLSQQVHDEFKRLGVSSDCNKLEGLNCEGFELDRGSYFYYVMRVFSADGSQGFYERFELLEFLSNLTYAHLSDHSTENIWYLIQPFEINQIS